MKSTDRLRRTLRSPVFIATIALVLRLLYLWTPPSRMRVGSIDGLGLGYEAGRIAQSIVSGRGYSSPFEAESGPTAWVPPALPFLLAADFKLFGMHSHAALVFILVLNEIFSLWLPASPGNSQSALFPRNKAGRKSWMYSLMIAVTISSSLN